jgi:RHS repeat-associated protein
VILLAEHDEVTLAAKKKRRRSASSRTTSTPKNRVWGFANTPSGRPVVELPLTQENATGSVRYTYENASGRAEWLSRDPFVNKRGNDAELTQGANLYWYVLNNATNAVDPSGLQSCCDGVVYDSTSECCIDGLVVEPKTDCPCGQYKMWTWKCEGYSSSDDCANDATNTSYIGVNLGPSALLQTGAGVGGLVVGGALGGVLALAPAAGLGVGWIGAWIICTTLMCCNPPSTA